VPALDLVDSGQESVGQAEPVFRTDRRSLDALDRLVIGEARARKREEIWATITGEIRAPEAYTRTDGRTVGGYGHLGVYPAEIVVERIVKTEIVPNPTYDYSEVLQKRAW
jgi:hypothetical protein